MHNSACTTTLGSLCPLFKSLIISALSLSLSLCTESALCNHLHSAGDGHHQLLHHLHNAADEHDGRKRSQHQLLNFKSTRQHGRRWSWLPVGTERRRLARFLALHFDQLAVWRFRCRSEPLQLHYSPPPAHPARHCLLLLAGGLDDGRVVQYHQLHLLAVPTADLHSRST